MPTKNKYLYQDLAIFITDLIEQGILLPRARVPSVRTISKQRKVSLSTVLQAYRLLEDQGILEVKSRSGFYVTMTGRVSLPIPKLTQPPRIAAHINTAEMMAELFKYASDPRFAPLGCAIPSPELLATGHLDRFVAKTARTNGAAHNVYTLPKGDLALRQQIARRTLDWKQPLSPEDIIITSGCTEAISLALRAITNPGDTVAIESPTYFGLLHIIESLNLKALELPTAADTGVDLTALEVAIKTSQIKVCLFSSCFNNPLGCTVPEDNKRLILDLLTKHKVVLIEDDIYGEVYFGKQRPKAYIELDNNNHTIYCSSFSKTIAPGYRIGWIIAQQFAHKVLDKKFSNTLSGVSLLQAAMADFLSSGYYEKHLRRMRSIFTDNINRTIRIIDQLFPKGTRVSQPAGGFVLWVELPKSINTRIIFKQALDKGICFAPGDVFSASDQYSHFLRLSCAHVWSESIKIALKTLAELITLESPLNLS